MAIKWDFGYRGLRTFAYAAESRRHVLTFLVTAAIYTYLMKCSMRREWFPWAGGFVAGQPWKLGSIAADGGHTIIIHIFRWGSRSLGPKPASSPCFHSPKLASKAPHLNGPTSPKIAPPPGCELPVGAGNHTRVICKSHDLNQSKIEWILKVIAVLDL